LYLLQDTTSGKDIILTEDFEYTPTTYLVLNKEEVEKVIENDSGIYIKFKCNGEFKKYKWSVLDEFFKQMIELYD